MSMTQRQWWHELNTWEPEMALAFYGRTLGWQFEPMALPDGQAYWVAKKDGRLVGGVFELTAPENEGVPTHWMTYLSVANMSDAEGQTCLAGGEMMRPPVKIPGVGKLALMADASGAMIGLIEPEAEPGFILTH
jgi:uncharacterized protein